MTFILAIQQPFSFAQTIAFLRRFEPCKGDYVLTDESLTAAVAIGERAVAFTIRDRRGELVLEPEAGAEARDVPELARRAAHLVGASDDLRPFYAAAAGDPAFRVIVEMLHGLHHVRFLTLEEIAVYSVLMQRTPIKLAALYKRRFVERFGIPVAVHGETLRAMPAFATLCALDPEDIRASIGHGPKAAAITTVVRGVASIGEDFLRSAPYADARDALLRIRGIGPFSAAAILLRGLGRMDEMPMAHCLDEARVVYGRDYDETAIRRRYGAHVGYWAFYLKTGVARLPGTQRKPVRSGSGRPRERRANVRA